MSTATQQIDGIGWFKGFFEMPAGAVSADRRRCPCCGSMTCQVSHRQDTTFAALRPVWSCLRCRRNGTGIFSLVRALNPKLATLDIARRWLEAQGVEVSDEIYQTGFNLFPLGEGGRNMVEQAQALKRNQARHDAIMAETRAAAETSVDARIGKLEAEISKLKKERAHAK